MIQLTPIRRRSLFLSFFYLFRMSPLRLMPFLLLYGALFSPASEVVLKSGTRMSDVRVVTRTAQTLKLETKYGVVEFPIANVLTIDGQYANPQDRPTPPPTPVPTPNVAPTVLHFSAPQPFPTVAPPAPLEAQAPAPADALPAPAAPPLETAKKPEPEAKAQATPSRPMKFNYEVVLVALLAISGLWMRCVFAVQQDLFDRRNDPRLWTLIALFLPVLGSGLYFAWARMQDMRAARQPAPPPEPAAADPAESWKKLSAPDPNAYVKKNRKTRSGLEFLDNERKSIVVKSNDEQSSGLETAKELLEEALLESASDVHIEPGSAAYRVRFRLDGILHERMSYDLTDGKRLVTALKSLAEIDIAEKRKAQDGHFRVSSEGREVDFRVATTSSLYGEKMVIRVLDHRSGIFDLSSLGMSQEMLEQFQQVIHSRNGMILATGPTGSGKTSTLYAVVRQLDTTSLNIMTIEDPAEYELTSITQIAVNPKAGITYESGLRSILRQDPDVILVGEMRDSEAAEIAVRAALTGHLMLSSLHTKDAIGTIARLHDMGIERYQAASALLMILGQRLVRVLCSDCRKSYSAKGDELESIGISLDPGATLYSPGGCANCRGTGFRGRTGIFELLVFDEDLRRMVGEGADEAALQDAAAERGFRSYRFDGAEKALLGITTVDEIIQAG